MYAPAISPDELWHHGIQGQKWGHKNGPPYPLDPKSDYSKEERKAVKKAYGEIRKHVSHVGRTDAKVASLNKKSQKLKAKSQYKKEIGKDNSKYEQKIKDSQDKIKKLLNDPKYKADNKILKQHMNTINKADIELGKKAVDRALNQKRFTTQLVGSLAGTAMYNAGIFACYAAGIPVNLPRFMVIPDMESTYANRYISKNRKSLQHADELYHHGILGMKWGKKNGPPYPLDAEDHSAAEKKAGYKKSISKGNGNSKDKNASDSEQTAQYSNDMKEVMKKHGYKKSKYDDDSYIWLESKNGPDIIADKDGSYAVDPKDIDEVLTNWSKTNKDEIFKNCKDYCWKKASTYWPENAGTREEFSEQFDNDYEFSSIWVRKWPGGRSAEVNIDMKDGIWESVMGDHELSGEFDLDFKNKPKYWSVNG